jgi:peptide/nickel transport system substrate-binding protein
MMSRRALVGGVASVALAQFAPVSLSRSALARMRTPYGGQVAVHVPWPLTSLDPHRIDDVAVAIFGDALFDTLYARNEAGEVVASLAESEPEPEGRDLRVAMRTDVRFASGAIFDARVAASSIARARTRDALAWLAEIPAPRVDKNGLVFALRDARRLMHALASPLLAMVPPRYSPERPDGTGPMRAEMRAGVLLLSRNTLAANGPSFLDSIEAHHAPDLVTPLRAFESGADDVGWLGSFLHEPRPGAQSFDAGAVSWAILRTGRDAGAFDVPGTAQALADGVPHASLASLVVGPPWQQGSATWTGPPCELLVRDDSPWLVEVARALSAALSSPSHEVATRLLPSADATQRRAMRAFSLMLDVARPAGPGSFGALIGLATADDAASARALARHPPLLDMTPRTMTRTMRIGVVGDVRLQGGRAPDVVLPPSRWGRGIDWGGAWRKRRVT